MLVSYAYLLTGLLSAPSLEHLLCSLARVWTQLTIMFIQSMTGKEANIQRCFALLASRTGVGECLVECALCHYGQTSIVSQKRGARIDPPEEVADVKVAKYKKDRCNLGQLGYTEISSALLRPWEPVPEPVEHQFSVLL